MLKFSDRMRKGQSPWIVDIYEKCFEDKTDGFLVEIGVGEVLDWTKMGFHSSTGSGPAGYINSSNSDRILDWDVDWDSGKIIQGDNHTVELIQQGWTGIYIDPLREFIDNELEPLFRKTLSEEHFNKIKFVRCGASDRKKMCELFQYESLRETDDSVSETDEIQPYNYQGRKVSCENTSVILEQNGAPKDIDFMLIDAEGAEIDIINGIDFSKHRPHLMFIEIYTTPLENIQNVLPSEYVHVMNDGLNALFAHSDFYYRID
jgi:FkbM family methyltransferase